MSRRVTFRRAGLGVLVLAVILDTAAALRVFVFPAANRRDEIRASRFVLVDSLGRVRAELGLHAVNGSLPGLVVYRSPWGPATSTAGSVVAGTWVEVVGVTGAGASLSVDEKAATLRLIDKGTAELTIGPDLSPKLLVVQDGRAAQFPEQ